MTKALNLAGRRFGKLEVIGPLGSKDGKSIWKCICDCGRTTIVKGVNLTRGVTRSCWCLRKANNLQHGQSYSATYRSWVAMKTRCTNENHHAFYRYGGRGIGIEKRWLKFKNFLADMGYRPKGMSLDRKNNDLGYSKKNCRWANRKEQSRNTIANRRLMFNGRSLCVKELSELSGVKKSTLLRRLNAGWSLRAAMEPIKKKGGLYGTQNSVV